MAEVQAELLRAVHIHQQGDLKQAEPIYRSILSAEPRHTGAAQLLGALMVQDGRAQEAVHLMEQVLAVEPNNAVCLGNLGTAYSRLKNYSKAIECYRRALSIEPTNAEAARNLGSVLLKARRFEEAVPTLQHARRLSPGLSAVEMHLAIALLKLGRNDEAAPLFEAVLQREPMHRQALAGLGQLLLKKTEAAERSEDCWRKLIQLEPANPAMYNNLATTLKGVSRFAEAAQACRQALEVRPGYFPALCNLGLILASENRFEESVEVLRQAVDSYGNSQSELEAHQTAGNPAIDPSQWQEFGCIAHCQLAAVTNMLGNAQEAERAVAGALRIDPNDVESRMMRGFLRLQCGQFELGWPDYECRKQGKHAPRTIRGPEWDGSPQPGRTILLHAEQGLGDSIQFIRYARLIRPLMGRIVYLCHKPLAKLLRSCPDVDEVVADGEPLPPYDFQVPLLSLPSIFRTSMATVPRDVPYLFADEAGIEKWRQRLSSIQGFRIAIAWQGNRDFANDSLRRVPLSQFGKLARIPGVQLICVQKGDGAEQLPTIDFKVHTFDDLDTTAGAFMDSAAIMKNVDLVISPCTATPHLAGALGVPVWLAKSFAAEWRWMSDDRPDNPWYPTMTMFRQPKLGDWDTVFENMARKVEQLAPGAARR